MSPELMQERAYDSKSDIWSLGCLIYELCALKPPFHEAKTHAELSIFIRSVVDCLTPARQKNLNSRSCRNGRIPPLPKGYSQALSSVIKAMLNLNVSNHIIRGCTLRFLSVLLLIQHFFAARDETFGSSAPPARALGARFQGFRD